MPYSSFSRVSEVQNDSFSKAAATELLMNVTSCLLSKPYPSFSRVSEVQNDSFSKAAATESLMNVTSCLPSMPYSSSNRSMHSMNRESLDLTPCTPMSALAASAPTRSRRTSSCSLTAWATFSARLSLAPVALSCNRFGHVGRQQFAQLRRDTGVPVATLFGLQHHQALVLQRERRCAADAHAEHECLRVLAQHPERLLDVALDAALVVPRPGVVLAQHGGHPLQRAEARIHLARVVAVQQDVYQVLPGQQPEQRKEV
eukprot:4379766-Prymnesium_polylepis.1